jgi:hypothetical protein
MGSTPPCSDPIVSYPLDADGFARANPPKFFLTFLDGGHTTPFLGGTNAEAVALQKTTVDFWNRYLKGDAGALTQLKTDAAVPGLTAFQDDRGPTTASHVKP